MTRERLVSSSTTWKLSLSLALVAIIVSAVAARIGFVAARSWEEAGQMGDFTSGFLGTGVSLAGMLLFFIALVLQTHELRQQREELEANREEMRESRRLAETQLGLAEETAVVTQVLACTSLVFEAERHKGEGKPEGETFLASDQLARIRKLLEVLLSRRRLDAQLVLSLSTLTDADLTEVS